MPPRLTIAYKGFVCSNVQQGWQQAVLAGSVAQYMYTSVRSKMQNKSWS